MQPIRLPSLAENVLEATLGAWRAMPGDAIAPGDILAELITEKASFEFEALHPGLLTHHLFAPGSVLPVGCVLALLDATDADYEIHHRENKALLARHALSLAAGLAGDPEAKAAPAPRIPPPDEKTPAAPAPITPAPAMPLAETSSIRATPAARRLAREEGADLAIIATRYPGEIIKESHIRDFLAAAHTGDGAE